MTRSNARPSAPATSIAASIAGEHAPAGCATALGAASSRPCRRSTLVATKAPSAMNTPWPKLSTSIRPNTSVRPEAMMKMIMPHRQAGDGERDPGRGRADQRQRRPAPAPATQQRAASSRSRRFGIASASAARRGGGAGMRSRVAHWCAPSDRPSRRCCSASSSASSAIVPRCTTRPSSITATRSPSALAPCRSSARPAGSSSPCA